MKGGEMSKLTFIIFALLVDICKHHIVVIGQVTECLNDLQLFQGSCYQLSSAKATRLGAVDACKPGHLVDIQSIQEQDLVVSLLAEADVNDSWIGLHKSLSWSDGSPLVFEAWQDIATDGMRDCFRMDKSKDYQWNDKSCDEKYQFICEYDVDKNTTCKKKFTSFQNSCYQIFKKRRSQSDAAWECSQNSPPGHLVDITTYEEQAFIVGMMSSNSDNNGDVWMGLTRNAHDPVWSDGSALTSGSWYDIRVNSRGACFRIQDTDTRMYRWDDVDCNKQQFRYVCEYEADKTDTTIVTSGTHPDDDTKNTAGIVVGSLIGVAVLIAVVIASALFAVMRTHVCKNHQQWQWLSRSNFTTRSTPHVPNQYHIVHRSQGPEYTYIESHLEPPPINMDANEEGPPVPIRDSSSSNGWRNNMHIITSDNMPLQTGWTDNIIYE